jgi:predicted outer membrane repeat protein
MRSILAIFFCLLVSPAFAQVSVGWDSDCHYNVNSDPQALQAALDAGHPEIRLTHQNDYAGVIDINHSVQLRGGYANCAAANAGNQDNIRAILDATGHARTAVRVTNIEDADVLLELLTITNGDGTLSNNPGGLDVKNLTGTLALDQLDVRGNSGFHGGGLSFVSNSSLAEGSLNVVITNTAIRNNTATRGGGLNCDTFHSSFDLQIQLSAGSTLRGNHATSDGGAIRMQSCQLDFEAGIANAVVGSNLGQEITQNTSNTSGGALMIAKTARVTLRGTETEAFDLTNNHGNLDDSVSGAGGAAQVTDGGELVLINASITNNSTGRYGGALFAGFGGNILVQRDPTGCSYNEFCSRMVGNRVTGLSPGSGSGGALAARFGGTISVHNTLLSMNNSVNHGYIGYAEQSANGQNATLLLEGNVIVENGQLADDANLTAIHLKADSQATLAYNTFFRNKVSSAILSQVSGSSLLAVGNILDEFGNIHHASGTFVAEINCNLVRSLTTIDVPVIDTFEGTPDYIDANANNLRLAAADTMAMDVCSQAPYLPGADMDGQPRGIDRIDVADLNGPFDLGAYEFDPAQLDVIFSDAFGQGF